jgi:zinc transport system ATP-binding protein
LSTPVVEVRDAAVALGGRPVLRHIHVRVEPGEWLAVLGANGSGKSTLLRAMLGLWPTSAGEVRLFGTPVERFQAWQRIGFVPQRAGAEGGVPASVREIVASGRLARRRPFRPAGRADRRAVQAALEAVDLADRAGDGIATLSGGQQQRALIARALAGEPDALFLDEPTAGVDLPHQQALAQTLRGLSEAGATVVLVAHELGPMAPLLDRAVVMRDGRVAYDGPPLTDAEVHGPVDEAHHHADPAAHDYAPHIDSPLERGGAS